MLPRLARWNGARIAMLWAVLIVVEIGVALATRVRDVPRPHAGAPASAERTPQPEWRANRDSVSRGVDATVQGPELRAPPDTAREGFHVLVDSFAVPIWKDLTTTVLRPGFFLGLGAIAVFFYGLPLALMVLTVLWAIARRRYARPAATTGSGR